MSDVTLHCVFGDIPAFFKYVAVISSHGALYVNIVRDMKNYFVPNSIHSGKTRLLRNGIFLFGK